MPNIRSTFKKFLCVFFLFLAVGYAHAAFHKSLWTKWEVNNPLSKEVISHQAWQEFLDRNIITNEEKINLVDYTHMSKKDLNLLKNYLKKMSHININNYNRNEQLAYWINLYNALVIKTAAAYYPISSIQEVNISPGLFSIGPWGANLIVVNGTPLSLDDINNRILRPIWNDPRIHYALNNASIGAPNIHNKAYQGQHISQQLNEAAFSYINSLRGTQVIEGKLILSKLYDWYEEDFGGSKNDVIYHLMQFAKEPLLSQLKHTNNIDNYVYNWHINSPAL